MKVVNQLSNLNKRRVHDSNDFMSPVPRTSDQMAPHTPRREPDDLIKKATKVQLTGLSQKKLKLSTFAFDHTRPDLQAKFKEIDPNGRIKDKETLSRFLAKTYQKTIADIISGFFSKHYFSDYATTVKPEDYYKAIQTFVNKDQREWQKFRFAIFDVKGEGKITEESLFKFMRAASERP